MSRSIFIAAALALAATLPAAPSCAEQLLYASDAGSGGVCTITQPCPLITAFTTLFPTGTTNARIVCVGAGSLPTSAGSALSVDNLTLEIDCPQGFLSNLEFGGNNLIVRLRGLTFRTSSFGQAISFPGSGTLILEDCAFVDVTGTALDIEPKGALNLVVKNSRVSNNTAAGVIIKPAAGGSVTATFDGVTITNNAGGLKTDTTNGPVRVDIFNSNISKNTNNGLVAIGGAGGQNMMTVKNDVIASNGQAGIEASGGTAGVLVNNTVLDSNIGGATLAVSGGRILTYGNNSTIGTPGSGFTGTTPLN